jgi:hypothetical protein
MVKVALPPDLRSRATVPLPLWEYVPSIFVFELQLIMAATMTVRETIRAILGMIRFFMGFLIRFNVERVRWVKTLLRVKRDFS